MWVGYPNWILVIAFAPICLVLLGAFIELCAKPAIKKLNAMVVNKNAAGRK